MARVQTLTIGYTEGRTEIQLIGSSKDQQKYAEHLFVNIMQSLHKPRLMRWLNEHNNFENQMLIIYLYVQKKIYVRWYAGSLTAGRQFFFVVCIS